MFYEPRFQVKNIDDISKVCYAFMKCDLLENQAIDVVDFSDIKIHSRAMKKGSFPHKVVLMSDDDFTLDTIKTILKENDGFATCSGYLTGTDKEVTLFAMIDNGEPCIMDSFSICEDDEKERLTSNMKNLIK